MKKLPAFFALIFAVVVSAFPAVTHAKDYCTVSVSSTYSSKYENIAPDSDLCAAMNYLTKRAVMSNFGTFTTADGYLRAGDFTNRAQAIAVVLNAFDPESAKIDLGHPPYGSQLGFSDTPPYDAQWWYAYALRGKQLGFINGYDDGSFRGGNSVTRAEFLKMFLAASPDRDKVIAFDAYNHRYVFNDLGDNFNTWYGKYVAFVGYNSQLRKAFENGRCALAKFCPSLPITTNEMALLMYQYHLWSGKELGFRVSPTPTPVPTPAAFTVPVLSTPGNGTIYDTAVTNRTVNFQWNASGASYYRFSMRLHPSDKYFVDQVVYTNSYSYPFLGISDAGYNGVQYFWRVTAYDNYGNSLASNEYSFQFKAASTGLGVPVLASPANGADFYNGNFNGNSHLSLNWYPTAGAVKYEVMYYFGGNSGNTKIYATPWTIYNLPSSALPTLNGPGYVLINWKVRAYDSYGNYKDSVQWSLKNTWQSTILETPILLSPSEGYAFNNPCGVGSLTFNWKAIPGATNYVFYFKNANLLYSIPTNVPSYTIETKLTSLDDGARFWWVRAYDGNGNYKDSALRNITISNLLCY